MGAAGGGAVFVNKDSWSSLNGHRFELEVAALLRRCGKNVSHVGGPGDCGIDLVIDEETAVQCKQHARPAAPAVARELLGAMHAKGLKKGILICPSGFTAGTKTFALKHGIELWDCDCLVRLAGGPIELLRDMDEWRDAQQARSDAEAASRPPARPRRRRTHGTGSPELLEDMEEWREEWRDRRL